MYLWRSAILVWIVICVMMAESWHFFFCCGLTKPTFPCQPKPILASPNPRLMMDQQEPLIQLPLGQLQHNINSPLQEGDASQTPHLGSDGKPRRTRSKWTQEETNDLIKGCGIHGVGNWKK
jgi:hypothetical protein